MAAAEAEESGLRVSWATTAMGDADERRWELVGEQRKLALRVPLVAVFIIDVFALRGAIPLFYLSARTAVVQ